MTTAYRLRSFAIADDMHLGFFGTTMLPQRGASAQIHRMNGRVPRYGERWPVRGVKAGGGRDP